MTCPNCGAVGLSPLTGTCELCGFSNATAVAVDHGRKVVEFARAQLAHEFELVDPVGHGARSAVFAAVERSTGKQVMLKVMERAAESRDADAVFRAAIAEQTTLDHPHIVPVLRFGATDSLLWFTRENIRATPLVDVLRQGSRLDVRRCRRLAIQLGSALEYLHRRGMTHGALTPANVLLDANGWVHLCDPALPATSTSSVPLGAPRRPRTDAPARLPAEDQRALAAILHECLCGTSPDAANPIRLSDPAIPPAMVAAIGRALRPSPADRFPSVLDFVAALEHGVPAPPGAPAARASSGVVFISDWEAPDEQGRVARLGLRVGMVVLVLGALAFAVPSVMRIVRPPAVVPSARPAPTPSPTTPAETDAAPNATSGAPGRLLRPPSTSSAATRTATPPAPAPAAPVGQAVLFVNSSPWGRLSIDDREVGNTPRANIVVAAGTRVVRVARDGYVPFERTLRLSAGDTVRLTDIVLVPRDR